MRQRKLLLPPFHGERIGRYGELIREITMREMERWPVGEPFALRPHTQRITLAVIMRAVFGVDDEERLARLGSLIDDFGARVNAVVALPDPPARPRPLEPWGRFVRARAALDEFIYEEIALRRAEIAAGGEDRDDVLSLLLGARHEDGSPMSDEELRDELVTVHRRRPRDDRDRPGLGDGADPADPAGARAAARLGRRRRGRLSRRDDQGDAAGAAGDRRRRAEADGAGADRRLRGAGRAVPDGGDRRDPLSRGPVPRSAAVPPGALPRRQARHLRLDPVRRRRPALHRRLLRRVRDAGRPAGVHRARRSPRSEPEPEPIRVRNITLAPGRGSRVVLERPLR